MVDDIGFNPEADLTNDSMPINEIEARIYTNDLINFGQWADLYDDNNHLFAHYWLRFAERIGRDDDRQTYIVRIIGQSPLAFLERVTMPAEMVDDDAEVLIMDILDYLGSMGHDGDIISSSDIDSNVGDIHITGFCPEQSARERLQWILTAAGGYALSAFNDVIAVNKIPLGSNSAGILIPAEKTFWKPTISYRDYVSSIKVTGYTFTEGTPSNVDEYVTDGTTYWIQQKQVVSVSNPSLPSGAPNNEIVIDDMTILSPSRASVVASILSNYYFNRVEVEADVINNCEYEPGMKVMVYTDRDTIYGGYISGCDFAFGLQTKSRIHLVGTYGVDVCELTINYMWNDFMVAQRKYYLPKNTPYSITTEYLDKTISGHRYIFRPTLLTVSGTLSSNTTATVPVAIALDHYLGSGSERSAIIRKMSTLKGYFLDAIKADEKAIKKAYKKDKYKKTRKKVLEKLEKEKTKTLTAYDEALSKMIEGIGLKQDILHIVSVDEVAEGESGIVDEGKVVIIDNGSSAGEDEYIILPPDSYTDDPWQGTHDDPERIYLTSIEVVSQPVKLSYAYGEQLNLAGLSVKAYYSDNTSETVTWACTFSPDDGATLTTAGVQTVTVAYVEDGIRKTTSFQISVAESQQVLLSSLSIASYPTKTSYDFNDQLDLTGVAVTAHYTDESTATVTWQCIFTPANGSSLTSSGTQIISVAYTEGGITRTTSFNITVAAPPKSLSSIAVTTNPTLMSYTVGDTLDLTGIVVTATYSDNSTANVTGLCTFSPANGATLQTAGTQAIAVSYAEDHITKTTSLNVSVAEYVPHTIPDNAYYKNSTITSFYDASAVAIGQNAFFSCPNLSVVSFPACLSIGEYAFEYCYALESVSFPVCTTMDYGAFRACTSKLSEVNFPQLSVVPSQAFAYCYSLVSASFPNATIIEGMAFESCSRLEQVYFPELLEIWDESFDGTVISQISLPKLISAGGGAFAYMSYLQEISLPNLEFIGTSAFKGCSVLSKVYLMNSSVVGCSNIGRDYFAYTPIAESSYLGYYGSIYVPQSLLTAYKSAVGWSVYSDRIVGI